jgi:hypothetical protein
MIDISGEEKKSGEVLKPAQERILTTSRIIRITGFIRVFDVEIAG